MERLLYGLKVIDLVLRVLDPLIVEHLVRHALELLFHIEKGVRHQAFIIDASFIVLDLILAPEHFESRVIDRIFTG